MSSFKLCILTFYHPGPEHKPNNENMINWNTGKHKRKYLKVSGKYIDCLDKENVYEDQLFFWGEWEPESYAGKIDNPVEEGPSYIYLPFYRVTPNYDDLEKTDPYVFGEDFCYTVCLQHEKRQNRMVSKQPRFLKLGSLILFGSLLGKNFVLDTVFVVSGVSVDHSRKNYREKLIEFVTPGYFDVVLKPLYQNPKHATDVSFNLYKGVNYYERSNYGGMFSFVPCLPGPEGEVGFARPVITLPDELISCDQNQNFKARKDVSVKYVAKMWKEVVQQVLDAGLKLGIYFEEPKCIK